MRIRNFTALSALLLVVTAAHVLAQQQPVEQLPMPAQSLDGHSVLRIQVPDEATLDTVFGLTDDVWSHHLAIGETIDVRVTPAQRAAIDQAGLDYTVFIENLEPLVAAERVRPLRDASFHESYHTYDEVNAFLDDMVATYPNLAQKVNLGGSYESRNMYALRITGNPTPGFKPAVFYIGCQHAREWITVAMTCYLIDHLLTNYGIDPEVTDLVDRVEWYILPITNPDGYVYTWTDNRMWRKNRRPFETATGVDLNRNWGTGWGLDSGSSGEPGQETYRGPSPFSEIETARLRAFINSHPSIRAFSDIHSYSELILWPWGYTPNLPENSEEYDYVGNHMGDLVYAVHGHWYNRGPIFSAIYPVSGDSSDWTQAVHGILSIGFELRDRGQYGFVLPPSQIVPASDEIVPALMYLASWIAPELLIEVPDELPSPPAGASVATIPVTVSDSGEIVQPGTETLYYRLNGQGPFLSAPLTYVSGDDFLAEIPLSCEPYAEFYIEATSTEGSIVQYPREAPLLLLTLENSTPIAIDPGPLEVYRCTGSNVTFTPSIDAVAPLGFQWRHDGVIMNGETDPSLVIDPITPADFGEYELAATDACGNVLISEPIALNEAALSFTQQPTSRNICPHLYPILSIATDVTTSVSYQWYRNDAPIPGATGAQLQLVDIGYEDEGEYFCVASLDCVSVESDRAYINVPRAEIVTQPLSRCANTGDEVVLTAVVEGDSPIIQWRKVGASSPVGVGQTLTLPSVSAADAGQYYVVAFTFPTICTDYSHEASLFVDTCTTCGDTVPGDQDGDSDLDLDDFAMLQRCFSSEATVTPGCECSDISGDGLIDDLDYELFRSDITGP